MSAANTGDIKQVLEFCKALAEDRQQRTSVRAVANGMAKRLMQVKMVAVPADDEEEEVWGAIAAKLVVA